MNEDKTAPLNEWNRLARENTENAIVSSMFEAIKPTSKPLDEFVTWLLVGTAAIASFFIVNADKLIPFLGVSGFKLCGAFLCFSGLFGLISKVFGLQCRMGSESSKAIRETFSIHLMQHKIEEEKIHENAKFWGITLETGIRMERVLATFMEPLPFWIKFMTARMLKKHSTNPQLAHIPFVNAFTRQGVCASLQAICFLGFIASGFVKAAI